MAETVNMQQKEYDSVLEKLNQIHEEELDSAREIAKKLQELCAINGDFYAENISKKVDTMMQYLMNKILVTYDLEFDYTCKVIEQFEQGVERIDTV